MKKELYNFRFWPLYIIITLLYVAMTYIINNFVLTNDVYYALLSDKMTVNRIIDVISIQHKYQIIGYFFMPILLLFKLLFIAGIVFIVFYLLRQEVQYKYCLKIIIFAEFISVIATLVKVIWLMIRQPRNVNDIQYFSPLSLTQLLNLDKLPKYLFYPLQLINVFEVAYWLVLAYGIMAYTNWKFEKSIKAVASSYGVALAVWVVIVMFIQLQFS